MYRHVAVGMSVSGGSSMAKQGRTELGGWMGHTKLNAGRKKAESERKHVVPLETARTLPSKPQPRGDTQINGNGLI